MLTDLQEKQMADKYVSQAEFERFERSNAQAFDEIRSAIGELARDLRQLARQPTNWGWVLSGVGTVLLIATSIGGLVAYGLNQRMDFNAERTDLIVQGMTVQTGCIQDNVDRIWPRVADNTDRITDLAERQAAMNSTQDARLDFLSRGFESTHGDRFSQRDYQQLILPELRQIVERINQLEKQLHQTPGVVDG